LKGSKFYTLGSPKSSELFSHTINKLMFQEKSQ